MTAAGESDRPGSLDVVLESSLREILSAIADGVIIVDGAGIVRFANPAAERMLARPASELVGQLFGFPLVAGETTELDVIRAGGSPLVVEMRAASMGWQGAPAILASLRDITDRKRTEDQRIDLVREQAARERAEAAVRARDEFLSVTAHELKTPVTRIRLIAQLASRLLERPDATSEDVRRRLEALDQETQKLSRLIVQLLDVSRLGTGKLPIDRRQVDLVKLVRDVIGGSQVDIDHHSVELIAPPELMATVDPLRFEQVVANLLDNAVKYSPDGGEIVVEIASALNGMVQLRVTDRGMGIAPEHRGGIFDRFYQAHAGNHLSGLGVGLFICRQIVELHGGQIEAEFPAWGGTRFVVSLPGDGGERPSPEHGSR
jgi:signal transduction histidine kinase